jgi:hypothetical protein
LQTSLAFVCLTRSEQARIAASIAPCSVPLPHEVPRWPFSVIATARLKRLPRKESRQAFAASAPPGPRYC